MFDFTVFDVETANSMCASICAIGVIRYENGKEVFSKSYLINPETEFDSYNTYIHGICAQHVENAPTFPQIWTEIAPYFTNTVLVAHNARRMDLCAIYRTLTKYGLPKVTNQYLCTYELSKALLSNQALRSFKLDAVADYFGVNLQNHHDALEDTRACCEVLLKMMSQYPESIVPQPYSGTDEDCSCFHASIVHYSDKTVQMQKLQDIVKDIIDDGIITDDEIKRLESWLEVHRNLMGFYPFDKIVNMVEAILYDGIFDEDEQQELLKLLDAFINPQTENCTIDICGKIVCLSGEFQHGTKTTIEQLLIDRGATVVQSVTAKVDILILGEVGSDAWKYGNYGTKYEKARQMQQKGKNIKIMKENDIL